MTSFNTLTRETGYTIEFAGKEESLGKMAGDSDGITMNHFVKSKVND